MKKAEMKVTETNWVETNIFRLKFEEGEVTYVVLFCTKCPSFCRLELPKDDLKEAPKQCGKPKKEEIASN